MIRGIGIDLIAIEKIRCAGLRLGDDFMNRIFTAEEGAYAGPSPTMIPRAIAIGNFKST